jgi:hypothetical protein
MKSLPRLGLLLTLVAGLAWTGEGFAQKGKGKKAPEKAKGTELLKVDDKLSTADAKDKVRTSCHSKAHPVKLEAGVLYTIDVVSDDFDPYLRLEDSQGKEVAKDDDKGGDFNARILFKADEAEYRVVVTTYSRGEVGRYRLTVTSTQAAPKDKSEKK